MWPGHMPLIPPEVNRESLEKWLKAWRSRETYISRLYIQESFMLTDSSAYANYHTYRNPDYKSDGPRFTLRCRIHGPAIKNYHPPREQSRPCTGRYELKVESDGFVRGWLPAPAVQSCYAPTEFQADLRWFFPPRVVVTDVRYDRDSGHTDIFFDFFVIPIDEYQLQRDIVHLDQYDAQLHDHIEDLIAEQDFQDPNMDLFDDQERELWRYLTREILRRKLALC